MSLSLPEPSRSPAAHPDQEDPALCPGANSPDVEEFSISSELSPGRKAAEKFITKLVHLESFKSTGHVGPTGPAFLQRRGQAWESPAGREKSPLRK